MKSSNRFFGIIVRTLMALALLGGLILFLRSVRTVSNTSSPEEGAARTAASPEDPSQRAVPEKELPVHPAILRKGDLRRSAEEAVITDGKTTMTVTISPDASKNVRQAAHFVARILGKMSGQTFQVIESTEPKGIVIGSVEQFPDAAVAGDLAKFGKVRMVDGLPIVEEEDAEGHRLWSGVEAFAIRTDAQGVRLLGQTEIGAVHAASRFLELLGVRRFAPSPVWEVIPRSEQIRFGSEEEQTSDYPIRDIWFAFGPNPSPEVGEDEYNNLEAWFFLNRSGRGNGAFQERSLHMFGNVYRRNKKEFDENRDKYYALQKGERKTPGKFCMAQPRVREMLVETVLQGFLDKDGNRVNFMSSVEPSDGAGWCECEECKAMGSIPERAFLLANEAAKAAENKYPGSNMVGMLAYYQYVDVPPFPLEPNLFVLLATRMDQGKLAMPDLLEEWPKHSKNVGLYDYPSTFVWGQDRLRDPGAYLPAGNPVQWAAELRDYYKKGFRYMIAESMPNFALYAPGYLVASKVMWDLHADEKKVLEDFYKNSFGSASDVMRQYYELRAPESGRFLDPNTLARLVSLLDEADRKAAGNAEVQARIHHLKLFHISDYFQRRMNQVPAADIADRKPWMLRLLTFVHQTRYDWVAHYAAWKSSAAGLATKWEEPTWNPLNKEKITPPWMQKDALEPAEFDALWREVTEYFQSENYHPITYDVKNLRVMENPLVEAPSEAPALPLVETGYFLNEDGSPLKFRIQLPEASSGKLASVWVYDEAGGTVFHQRFEEKSGSPDAPDRWTSLEVPVPAKGLYSVKVFGASKFSPELGQRFFTREAEAIHFLSPAERYFYVPPNVEEIVSYSPDNRSVTLIPPHGAPLKWDPDGTNILRLPVSAEDRGAVWKTPSANVHFLNIPNIFSYDPHNVIVPAGVADEQTKK